ncbi:MAG: glycosyltransferase family 4 protein [Gammaproteobacteria bacterium]|nr:glycosyltransferase family 4 protein [Gammaproteobacteria bacterium]
MSSGRRLRIAVVAACPLPAARGTPIRIFRLSEALYELGHDIHVVTYHLGQQQVPHNFHLHRIKELSWYSRTQAGPSYRKLAVDLYLAKKLREVIDREAIEVIHAHHFEGLLVALLARRNRKLPIVFDAHTLLGTELSSYALGMPSKIKTVLGRFLDRQLPCRATHVVGVSQQIRDTLVAIQAVEARNISVVPNGVELDHLASGIENEKTHAGKVLVFTGNLAPYQGIDVMLTAFAAVCRERDDTFLHIVSGDTFQAFERMAEQLGIRDRIKLFPEAFTALPDILANADIALNPRMDCDGVPQKLLNYMAARCPIVSFAGSARHLEHAKSGWVVDQADPQAFAEAILALLDDPALARRLGETAHEVAKATLSWEASARKIETILHDVIARA